MGGPLAAFSSLRVKTVVFAVIGLLVQLFVSWFLIKRSLSPASAAENGNAGSGAGGGGRGTINDK